MSSEILLVFVVSCFLKLLTITDKMYRSTDFEVHRNWLAITHSLPFSQWYTECTSIWTLDYPPFFAYFEYFLSVFAQFFDPAMLKVENLEYASVGTILFQRLTVIFISDGILLVGVYWSLRNSKMQLPGVCLALFSSTLFIVDHIHFQYNGLVLGLLLISSALVESGRFYSGALIYAILVYMKHIFLFSAPVYLVFYLRHALGRGFLKAVGRVFNLVSILALVSIIALGPLAYTGQLPAAIARLFPFGRGLMHANWSANFWAVYLAIDRLVGKILGYSDVLSPTRGIVGVTSTVWLPTITPQISLTVVGTAYVLLLIVMWGKSSAQNFAVWLAFGNAVVFEFGYHIHEKAAMMILFPLLIHALRYGDAFYMVNYQLLSLATCVTVLPLLFRETDTVLKWTIFLAGFCLEQTLLRTKWAKTDMAIAMSCIAPEIYRVSIQGVWILKNGEYPFIPIMLNSVINAIMMGFVLARYFLHFLKTQPLKYIQSNPM